MKKRTKIIFILIISIVILGVVFGIVDYNKIKNNMTPVFCVVILDRPNNNQTCWGLGYKVQRQFVVSSDQPFGKTQKFALWFAKKLKFKYDRANRHFLEIRGTLGINDSILYYTDKEGIKYYLYSLKSVTVNFEDEAISLKKALEKHKITIDEIVSNLTLEETYEDGGSTIYKDNEIEYSNGISILKCNTTDGNKDVYIGHAAIKYDKAFCK